MICHGHQFEVFADMALETLCFATPFALVPLAIEGLCALVAKIRQNAPTWRRTATTLAATVDSHTCVANAYVATRPTGEWLATVRHSRISDFFG